MKQLRFGFLFLMTVLFSACKDENNGITQSGAPTISSFTPAQISRGVEDLEGRILGDNLSGVISVSFGDGITVKSAQSLSNGEISVVLSVAGNTSSGQRAVTVATPGGTVTANALVSVLANRAPEADFDVTSGSLQIPFTFDGSSSSDPDNNLGSYLWDFGDGTTDNGKKVTHSFTETKQYEVTLTVKDKNQAQDVETKTVEVLRNSPPTAVISASPNSGTTLTDFLFESRSTDPDGRILEEVWRFGDGKSARGSSVNHTYTKGGTFTVELTVADNKDQKSTAQKEIEVEKVDGVRCTPRHVDRGPEFVFTVVSADRATKTILAKFQGNPGCKPFSKCGDIRLGGYPGVSPGPEYWVGIMCEFIDLGNGMAQIKVDRGNFWPTNGQTRLYTWPQECNIPGVCGGK